MERWCWRQQEGGKGVQRMTRYTEADPEPRDDFCRRTQTLDRTDGLRFPLCCSQTNSIHTAAQVTQSPSPYAHILTYATCQRMLGFKCMLSGYPTPETRSAKGLSFWHCFFCALKKLAFAWLNRLSHVHLRAQQLPPGCPWVILSFNPT